MTSAVLIAWLVMTQDAAAVAQSEVTPKAILGLEVGMPLAAARDRLRPLGRSDGRDVSGGAKHVWHLDGTGFEWIALRSDAEGRVVWITGHRRAGRELPFDSIGSTPRTATDDIAIWNADGTYGGQRLTLRGAKRLAKVVTLAAVKP